MAVDTQSFRLLLAAHRAGVDFSRTLTLGRQNYYPRRALARRALSAAGLSPDAADQLAGRHVYAEPFFRFLGARTVDSMDASDYEQATIVHDLNRPLAAPLPPFTAIYDGGTSEHVYNYPQLIDTVIRLLAIGSHFVTITTNSNFSGHGFYQFSPELFFRVFAPENGFETRAVLITALRPGCPFYRVLDPAVLRQRVEYVTREPYCVAAIVKKTAAVNGLNTIPLQSDYQARWGEGDSRRSSKLQRELHRLRDQFRRFIGRHGAFTWQSPGLQRLDDSTLYSL